MSLAISIVLYDNGGELEKTLRCVLNSSLPFQLYLIDNSATDAFKSLATDPRIRYVFNGANKGYGGGHNIALRESIMQGHKYHLVMNPDVLFIEDTLERIMAYMEAHEEVGSIMPKVHNPDGTIQRLCKLLPGPADLFLRRFLGKTSLAKAQNRKYELQNFNYNAVLNTPCLSGCFMFIRTAALQKAGIFDERFFMYMEDYDLTRRIHQYYQTLFYPEVSIIHLYKQGSYKNSALLMLHLKSAIKYFNKWGWFTDKVRSRFNKEVLKRIEELG